MSILDNYIKKNERLFIAELLDFLRIPSVSADSTYHSGILKAADFVAQALRKIKADKVQIFETEGNPIVYGEIIGAENLPTVLVYGHYDVQPPSPLDLWDSPPFEPVIKDAKIYARGACDDKGQMFMPIKAVQALLETQMPTCNLKFIFEGEEEISSASLAPFMEKYRDLLQADIALICDTAMPDNDTPAITVGLRGISYIEIELTACKQDLHSGVYGGAAPNAIHILVDLLNRLKDKDQRVTVPNFYEGIPEPSRKLRAELAQVPFDETDFKTELGVEHTVTEKDYTPAEGMTIRPTLDVNGIWGGYIDEGAKTVIPAKAHAKLSMRLVEGQDPKMIEQSFIEYLKQLVPQDIELNFTIHQGNKAITVPTTSKVFQAADRACLETFGREPLKIYGGGSIPVVAYFKDILNLGTILLGFGLNSDNVHAPNEHYGIYNYMIGIRTLAKFFNLCSASKE